MPKDVKLVRTFNTDTVNRFISVSLYDNYNQNLYGTKTTVEILTSEFTMPDKNTLNVKLLNR